MVIKKHSKEELTVKEAPSVGEEVPEPVHKHVPYQFARKDDRESNLYGVEESFAPFEDVIVDQ